MEVVDGGGGGQYLNEGGGERYSGVFLNLRLCSWVFMNHK